MSNGDSIGLEWAGTVIGGAVVLSFVVLIILVAIGMASLSPISQAWFALYSMIVVLGMIQVVGKDVWKTYRDSK